MTRNCYKTIILLFIACAAHPAGAAIINVPADQPTIQDGIDAATNGDEVLVSPGTYFETINFNGKAITLRSSDGADVTIIDAPGLHDSVVKCVSAEGPDTVMEGFTITGGVGHSFAANTRYGGGMYNEGSNPTVSRCVFTQNHLITPTGANQGGGMFNLNSSPIVIDCAFSNNSVTDTGGGMNNSSSSSPMVVGSLFIGNSARISGGGMYNLNGSNPTVLNCIFVLNVATGSAGGGMHCGRSVNDISSNPIVMNCSFIGNTAAHRGGGMFNHGMSNPNITNCTYYGNSAVSGGGMYNSDINGATNVAISNCVFWSNSDGGGADASAQIHDETASSSNVRHSNIQGGWTGAGISNIDADPLFVDPLGPDGVPGTEDDDLRLQLGSPCIDAGDNTAVPADTLDLDGDGDTTEPIPFDLYGDPRIVGVSVDVGAYEFPAGGSCVLDDDHDGVNNCDDQCPDTPPGEPVNSNGCSCSQLDDDNDGVNNCDDECPSEDASGLDADMDGCIDDTAGEIELIESLPDDALSDQIKNSLISKIEAADRQATRENLCAAINALEALKNQVEAQRGVKIDDASTDLIIEYTNNLITQLADQLSPDDNCAGGSTGRAAAEDGTGIVLPVAPASQACGISLFGLVFPLPFCIWHLRARKMRRRSTIRRLR